MGAGAVTFGLLVPAALAKAADFLGDRRGSAGWRFHHWEVPALLVGGAGIMLAAWSVRVLYRDGRGTPAPLMPTRTLLTHGPYAWCRNPMTLGVLLYYGAVALWRESLMMLLLVGLFGGIMLLYIKLVEERELEARFGETFRRYCETTPFIVPRLMRRRKVSEKDEGS